MKKLIAGMLIAVMALSTAVPVAQAKNPERGGVVGFFTGCCLGMRAGGDYNEGKSSHWREWCRVIPYVGLIFAIWDGIEAAGGTTTADYAEQYGSTYF